jgi:hypothetical protein
MVVSDERVMEHVASSLLTSTKFGIQGLCNELMDLRRSCPAIRSDLRGVLLKVARRADGRAKVAVLSYEAIEMGQADKQKEIL